MGEAHEAVLAHGGADSTATFLIFAALGVSGLVPVIALVLFLVLRNGPRKPSRQGADQ